MTAPPLSPSSPSESAGDYVDYATATYPPPVAQEIATLTSLRARKLWHQLGVRLLRFVAPPAPDAAVHPRVPPGDDAALRLYAALVRPSAPRLNQLTLARVVACVAGSLGDPAAAATLLAGALERRAGLGAGPALYLDAHAALLCLGRGEHAQCAEYLEGAGELAGLAGGEMGGEAAVVHSAYHRTAQAYYKVVGPPRSFYESALLYLSYTPHDSMTPEERYSLATDLSLAALTGDGVHNFGELVTHPILTALTGTPNAWLLDTMLAAGDGDVKRFRQVARDHAAAAARQPALVGRGRAVEEKVTLLAVVDLAFRRGADDRTLTFAEVAERAGVGVGEVEGVLMRALSLGLIRGSMDQVDGTVDVTWVLPRVLDKSQMEALAQRFGDWAKKVEKAHDYANEHTAELFS